jgi:hypothetical protein
MEIESSEESCAVSALESCNRTQSPAPYKKVLADRREDNNRFIHKYESTFIYVHRFYHLLLPCPSSPRAWFNLYRFVLKRGRFSSTKARDLCCFARKAIARRHESTTIILVLRGNFSCQHNWRLHWGRSINRSLARSCYVKSVIKKL